MLEMRLEDESAVPLRAIAFAQQAEAFEETFHVGDSVVVKGGVVKALEQRFRKGDWKDTKMELIFRWWTMVESSPEPVAPGYPADNEPSEAPTTASKRLNCYDRLMELRTRWAAANDGAELPIINVENEFGKEPTTFFFVDGVWQRGKTAFCALLSKVDMPDADTSVHEDLLKHLSTYGAGHEKSMVRFMTTMEWCDVNNRLKPGEYPFADGILNLLSGERRPISPEDYLTKKSSRKMPDRETWDGVVDTYEFKNVSEQFQKILPCKGLQEEVMWRLAVYLMDPDKSLHKQHLNIYGHKNNAKTFLAQMLEFGFGEVWVRNFELVKLQVGSQDNPHAAAPWMVKLFGCRLAYGEEGEKEGGKLRPASSNKLKLAGGNVRITARLMGENDLPSVRPTWAYLMLTNPVMPVQSEEEQDGHREAELVARLRAPANFQHSHEYHYYLAHPGELPKIYEPDKCHIRQPEVVKEIVEQQGEAGERYALAIMRYVTLHYERYLQLLQHTKKWYEPDPELVKQHIESSFAARRAGQPEPPPPLSQEGKRMLMSEEERQEAFDFHALSGGEVDDYDGFIALISPISRPRNTIYRYQPRGIGGDAPSLEETLMQLFEVTGRIKTVGSVSEDYLYLDDIMHRVRDNVISGREHMKVTPNDVKQIYDGNLSSGTLQLKKLKRKDPGDPSKRLNKLAFLGLKVQDEILLADEAGLSPEAFVEQCRKNVEKARQAEASAHAAEERARKQAEAERKHRERCMAMLEEPYCAPGTGAELDSSQRSTLKKVLQELAAKNVLEKAADLSVPLDRLLFLVYDSYILDQPPRLPFALEFKLQPLLIDGERVALEPPIELKLHIVSEVARVYGNSIGAFLLTVGDRPYAIQDGQVKGLCESGRRLPLASGEVLRDQILSPVPSTIGKRSQSSPALSSPSKRSLGRKPGAGCSSD